MPAWSVRSKGWHIDNGHTRPVDNEKSMLGNVGMEAFCDNISRGFSCHKRCITLRASSLKTIEHEFSVTIEMRYAPVAAHGVVV